MLRLGKYKIYKGFVFSSAPTPAINNERSLTLVKTSLDIDEKDMILSSRRKRIERKILKISAKEIASHIFCLVRGNCEECNTIHLSQTHHPCLSMGKFKRLEYFNGALEMT